MTKLIREVKWLAVSTLIVIGAIVLIIAIGNFSQWKVELNVARYEAGQVDWVGWNGNDERGN